MLAGWRIPEELLEAVPQTPFFFHAPSFIGARDDALARATDTPSDQIARQVLPAGGTVLDVGCGAGAASLRLRPRRVVGVDQSGPLLTALADAARSLGIDADVIEGRWPDCSGVVDRADVVVCHHVFYNVPDLAAFAAALAGHARQRVVVEMTAVHPLAWLNPYWKALHGLDRPDRPTADDALAVLGEIGLEANQSRWRRRNRMLDENGADALARIARRLCLPPHRHDELRRLLEAAPPPVDHDLVTLWW